MIYDWSSQLHTQLLKPVVKLKPEKIQAWNSYPVQAWILLGFNFTTA